MESTNKLDTAFKGIEMVNHPNHYTAQTSPLLAHVRDALLEDDGVDPINIECFEAMLSMLPSVEEVRGYLRGNSFKYRWRYPLKGGLIDIKKAEWYEKKLRLLEEALIESYK